MKLHRFLRRNYWDRERALEVESHLQHEIDDNLARGMTPEDAQRLAYLKFGNPSRVREEIRQMNSIAFLENLSRDFRYALRRLGKAPGFTLTAILTLALGIGATTAIFTLVQQVMFKSLPVARPSQLWRIGKAIHCCEWGGYVQEPEYSLFSWQLYRYFRDHSPEFTNLAAFEAETSDMGVRRVGSSHPAEDHPSQFVSGNFFATFGVKPWIGRVLRNSDDRVGATPVAVMSYRVWKQSYGSNPSVVDSTFEIDGHPLTVVGVAAPGFYGAMQSSWANPDFWIPLSDEPLLNGASSLLHHDDENWLDIIGRVRTDTNPAALQSQLKVELHQWQVSHLDGMSAADKRFLPKQKLYLTPGGSGVAMLRSNYAKDLRLLMIVAGCVLLIACANLANLLLARGLKELPQTSVHSALGATRAALVRKAFVESMTLGLMGGAAGVAVAYGGAALILHLAFSGPGTWVPVHAEPSWTVLLFALAVALATGMLFGIAPAWMASRVQPIDALRGANRSTPGSGAWARRLLVIGQTAVSLVLLSSAALLALSLRNMEQHDFGFQVKGRYIAAFDPEMAGYKTAQMPHFYGDLMERIRRIPGVRAASAAMGVPMSGYSWNGEVRVEGQPAPASGHEIYPAWTRVTPGYFASLGQRILLGRAFSKRDNQSSQKVAIVNEAFVKTYFKGKNPLGQHFGRGSDPKDAGDYEIVGVAANAPWNAWNIGSPVKAGYYLPEAQTLSFANPDQEMNEAQSQDLGTIVLWAQGNPPGLEAQVQKVLNSVNPNLPLTSFSTYAEFIDSQFSGQSMIAQMVSLFGLLALVLAAVGLYGVTAYGVEQRTSEIGVRMALGADRGSVVAMVLRGAFLQVGIGLALGVPGAIAAGYVMASRLFGVVPWNPATLMLAVALLGAAALVASVVPARRAASIDPMQALRTE